MTVPDATEQGLFLIADDDESSREILYDVLGRFGYTLCEQLRREPRTEAVPIIMITALDERDSRLRGLAAGADEFLTKPVDGLELRTRVQTVTRLKRYRLLL